MALNKPYAGLTGASITAAASSAASSTGPTGLVLPPGLTRFINDSSYSPQSETTIAVDPSNPSHVLGGYDDARWFFCPLIRAAECPNGYSKSVTGFTVSTNGGTSLLKSNDLPAVSATETNLTSGKPVQSLVLSWGDPSVAPAPGGNFYFSTLAIDPATGANGIMIQISNSNLWDPGNSCASLLGSPSTNACWTAHLVSGNFSFQCLGPHICGTNTLEDKDTIAVDTDPSSSTFGDAYVAWDHFYPNGQSSGFLAICTPTLSCTMLSGGGASSIVTSTDKFAGNTTPEVSSDGTVYLSWCNFGTATAFGPVYCNIRSSPAGGASFGPVNPVMSFMGTGTQLAGDTVIVGFATEQFRTASELTIVAGAGGDVYFAIPLCTSGFYYRFVNSTFLPTDNPGSCGFSGIFFTKSTNHGTNWSTPTQLSATAVVIQPTLAYDQKSGAVVLAYYTTQFDPFNHRIDVVAQISKDRGETFTQIRATQVSNEPDSDPAQYDYTRGNGFGGSFVVPQYGDYFTAWAYNGKMWILFTGNYVPEQGTLKASPFLTVVGESPSTLSFSANSKDAAPGDKVSFTASGFTGGSTLSLRLNWNGVEVKLVNATVSSTGQASGNFTVPNVQSQVYRVVAADGTGLTSSAPLGVGQVSLGGVQSALASLQAAVMTIQNGVTAVQNSLQTSLPSSFASLNSTVVNTGNSLSNSISHIGSGISSSLSGASSTLSVIEYLSIIIIVLLVVVIALQFRKGNTSSYVPPYMPSSSP